MDKYLLLSVLVANVALPTLFAADPLPRRGLRRAVLSVFAFDAAYCLALLYLYPLLIK
jgi:hypothetical protein